MKKRRLLQKYFVCLIIVMLFVFLVSCSNNDINQENCEHAFEDGVCMNCHYKCTHPCFDDDVCIVCGVSYQNICDHEFEKGECLNCFYKCPHINATCGICDECHMNIQNNCHHTYVNGVCTHCEYECDHSVLTKGICRICGIDYRNLCEHEYVGGVCKICTYQCSHGATYCGELCSICKSTATHRLEGGICTMCGYENHFTTTAIPDEFLNTNCPEKGTVEKVVFESYDYAKNIPYENTFYVYLPYGYDAKSNKEYNVLYLLHGSGENSAYWLAQAGYKGGYTETTKVVLDNLHYYKTCEETIVVTPTENLNGTANFYKELINNIMPQAESRYKTKAHLYGKDIKDIKSEDFIASRDYRAYAGLSLGSMIGWSIMAHDLPYFSYYGYYSGGTWNTFCHQYLVTIENNLQDKNNKYDIKYAFHSCGDQDSMYKNHLDDYNEVVAQSNGKLVDEVNCCFLVKPGFAHRYNAWIIDLYNSLGYCFFKYNE